MKKGFFLIVFFVMCFVSFGQDTPKSIEESIEEYLEYLDRKLTEEFKVEFKNKEEEKAALELHMNIGMGIRNGWLRHGNGKDELLEEFYKIGFFDYDDISHFLFVLFHKKLNNQNFDLKEELKNIKRKWYIESNVSDYIIEIYHFYTINDKIDFYILIKNNKQNEGTFYYFDENQDFERDKFYKVSGIVKHKIEETMFLELTYLESDKIYLYKKERLKIEENSHQGFDFRKLKTE